MREESVFFERKKPLSVRGAISEIQPEGQLKSSLSGRTKGGQKGNRSAPIYAKKGRQNCFKSSKRPRGARWKSPPSYLPGNKYFGRGREVRCQKRMPPGAIRGERSLSVKSGRETIFFIDNFSRAKWYQNLRGKKRVNLGVGKLRSSHTECS